MVAMIVIVVVIVGPKTIGTVDDFLQFTTI
jgi:hypothetical protein